MKVQKFVPPYTDAGKPRLKNTWKKSGVYLIKENNKIVYIGHSGYNLYKTMYRHFQNWDSHQTRATYKAKGNKRKKYLVQIIFCTPKQTDKIETEKIKKYNPRDNVYSGRSYLEVKEKKQKTKKLPKTKIPIWLKPTKKVPF